MEPSPAANAASGAARVLARAALAAAAVLLALLSLRPQVSADLGYHLAYGEEFLRTGKPVDSSPFIYTLPATWAEKPQPPPGPGCWYDDAGIYHFPNANWLSQAVMAATYRWGGGQGLSVLGAVLVLAGVALSALSLRRLGGGAAACAACVLLIAMTGYERFNLRPEVFAYAVLAGQLYLLCGRATWARTAAMVALQLLLVNLHSYYLLGLALTGAFFADRVLRLAWWRVRRVAPPSLEVRRQATMLGTAMAAKAAVAFVNPWGWRIAALPFETLAFLHGHRLWEAQPSSGAWATIGEVISPLSPLANTGLWSVAWFKALLVLLAAGAVCAAWRRRWDWLIVIVLLAGVGVSMRRNMAFCALLGAPLALAAVTGVVGRWGRAWLTAGGAAAVALVSAGLCVSVATQDFYFAQRLPWRLGVGLSPTVLPLGASEWLTRNQPQGRLWTDFDASSNLHYFTAPKPPVPILTNTWAVPPAVMESVLGWLTGTLDFDWARKRFGLESAAFAVDRTTALQGTGYRPLLEVVRDDPAWRLVCIDGRFVVYVRDDGPNAELAARAAITPGNFAVREYIERLRRAGPVPAHALYQGGTTLFLLGWNAHAAELFAAATGDRENYHEAWRMLGASHARMGDERLRAGDRPGAVRQWQLAQEALERSLHIRPDYAPAATDLRAVRQSLGRS